MAWLLGRDETHEIPPPLPSVSLSAHEIFDLERLFLRNPELLQGNMDHSVLSVPGIEVDDDEKLVPGNDL